MHNARRVHKVVTESDVANVEIISWNCIIILHVNLYTVSFIEVGSLCHQQKLTLSVEYLSSKINLK